MQNVGLVGEGRHSELTGCTFEVHLRGKPGIVEEIPKGLKQKMFSSHIVSQESEERWALGKSLGRGKAATCRRSRTKETSPVDKKIHAQQCTWSLHTEHHREVQR